ncbi:hypothetical protein FRC17_005063 [Serendipita sp. 399]|nr:hypothetical protein FRC17_005063 [Serendipita sp. 399]
MALNPSEGPCIARVAKVNRKAKSGSSTSSSWTQPGYMARIHPISLCMYIALLYWADPGFYSYFRRDGFLKMWVDPHFLWRFMRWVVCYAVVYYFIRLNTYTIPKVWKVKARQIIRRWGTEKEKENGEARFILVLGDDTDLISFTFSRRLSVSDNRRDTLFIPIEGCEWSFTKADMKSMIKSVSTKFSLERVVIHSVMEEEKEEGGEAPDQAEVVFQNPQLPFDSNSMDLVLSSDAIPSELELIESFLSEIIRVLKPGGHAIIMTPNLARYGAQTVRKYLEKASVDFGVEERAGYSWYEVTKLILEKV